MAHATSTQELAQANSAFLQQQRQGMTGSELFTARASAGSALPRSLRSCASDVLHHMKRRHLLNERLQLLLGIQNGARPDDRPVCKLTLHCKCVGSVQGYGISELRGWLYDLCRSLPFVGQMISSWWAAIADVSSTLEALFFRGLMRFRWFGSTCPI